jgi:MFS family permease
MHSATNRYSRIGVGLVLTALFSYSLLETMIEPALPEIRKIFGASPAELGWVFTGLLLSGAVSTPLVGRLAEIYDERWVVLWTLVIVCVGVIISGSASTIHMLAVGQVLQGVGLGLVPLSIAIMNETLPAAKAALGNGLVIAAVSSSTAAGLISSGPIVQALGIRWLYWLPLVLLASCAAGILLLQLLRPVARVRRPAQAVDWIGALLLAAVLLSLLIGITCGPDWGWRSPRVRLLFASAAAWFSLWVFAERRLRSPLFDVRMLSDRRTALGCLIAFAVGFGSVSSYVLVPFMVQSGAGGGLASATIGDSGFYVLPLGLAGTLSATLVGNFERLLGPRWVMLWGTIMLSVGVCMLSVWHSEGWQIMLSMALVGLGLGCALTEVMNAVTITSGAGRAASVSGMVFVIRNIGGTTGAQLCASLISDATEPVTRLVAPEGYATALSVAAAVSATSILGALLFPGRLHEIAKPMSVARENVMSTRKA